LDILIFIKPKLFHKNRLQVRVLESESGVAVEHRAQASPQDGVTRRDVVEEITNQRVSRAKDFLSRYKCPRSYLSIVDAMGQPASANRIPDFVVTRDTSVFDLPTFSLKLAPDPIENFG
jgi:hypothetical protein